MTVRDPSKKVTLEARESGFHAACFTAMASPCEVLFETDDRALALRLGQIAAEETWRIERKYSRYAADSVLSRINRSNGSEVEVDAETAGLIDFAAHCHAISDGLFDVTSGVLRRAWKFDGSDRIPSAASIAALLPSIGFARLAWNKPYIAMPAGMELDFGGIGKEYAVDRAVDLVRNESGVPALINLGGDLRATAEPTSGPWRVGIERPDENGVAVKLLELRAGALATSGDTRRFLLRDGIRYSHILDPRSGWPVTGGPRSVTVAAETCVEAGMLATIALLHGVGARAMLDDAGVRYWCVDD